MLIIGMIQTLFKEKLNDLFSEIFLKWEFILCWLPQTTSKRTGLAQEERRWELWGLTPRKAKSSFHTFKSCIISMSLFVKSPHPYPQGGPMN